MKLEMRGDMRMEQRMMLAPRMIQSMEILQLPILALQEKIEQELNSNPVLEIAEPTNPDEQNPIEQLASGGAEQEDEKSGEKTLVVDTDPKKVKDFERLENLGDDYRDYMTQAESFRRAFHQATSPTENWRR